ncbi:MAG: MCE family protein [Jatrophihabitans sp.]|uniref:MCE family protein n=1 Tax=Jatrophihabitans sp. TaxID=1932789 RepID=UPI003F7DD015
MRGLAAPLIKLIIFLVVTATATLVLAGIISNSISGDTTTYKAMFTDATGVQEGDDVRIAGVRVGTVDGVQLVRPKQGGRSEAEVTFDVLSSRPLPKSTNVTIRYRNLVGQRYLNVTQGAGDSTAMLKSGDTIPIEQTQPALDLTVLFGGFKNIVAGLSADQINLLSDEVVQSLQGEGGAIQALFGTVADLTNSLADKDQVIGDVIDNLSTTLTTLDAHDAQLSDLIVQLRRFVSGLAQDRTQLGQAIVGINQLTTRTSNLFTDARAPLAKDVKDLTGLVGVLNDNQTGPNGLQNLITELPPTIAGLIRTASYGSWFNFYLCDVTGYITLPSGQQAPLNTQSTDARCN